MALTVLRKSGVAGDDTPPEQVSELLATTTYDGIALAPLYTADTVVPAAGLPGLAPFVRGGHPLGAVVGGWDVRQRHAHPDPAVSRQEIAADLDNGVTSVWLALGDGYPGPDALPDLLADVRLDLAGVVLDAGGQTAAAAAGFLELVQARGVATDAVTGNLGADPLGARVRTGAPLDLAVVSTLAARTAAGFPGLRAVLVDATPYHDAGGSDAEELGCALATGVAYLRALVDGGLDQVAALGQLEFRYAVTADQFLSIAKLRAARRLWARVAEVCGVPAAGAQRQHAVTSSAMMTARDPWVNILRTTLAGFAAAVGGADSVTVTPFDACLGLSDTSARRIARNTQALLLDESHLGRVLDPAGGSWYVEHLTEDLARAAWAWFTEIERAGGMAAALDSGLVAQRLDATWAARVRNIRYRRDALTGVSEFPNLTEQLPLRPPAPVPANTGLLPTRRYAAVFETFRDAADAHAAATGARPTVFLATLGPVAAHTARAAFATNLFASGGIAAVTSGTSTDPTEIAEAFTKSGLTVACLCGTDRTYGEKATEVATALAAAGAKRVWLAGKPADYGGVDSYLFAGCDAAAVVESALSDLEVGAEQS